MVAMSLMDENNFCIYHDEKNLNLNKEKCEQTPYSFSWIWTEYERVNNWGHYGTSEKSGWFRPYQVFVVKPHIPKRFSWSHDDRFFCRRHWDDDENSEYYDEVCEIYEEHRKIRSGYTKELYTDLDIYRNRFLFYLYMLSTYKTGYDLIGSTKEMCEFLNRYLTTLKAILGKDSKSLENKIIISVGNRFDEIRNEEQKKRAAGTITNNP